ncbi:hypothetical protein AOQ84DRAFT_294188 [Glonium stellatum]|uniref:Uncharacterized protein n=1 Tax=Glonium stellatum TaxID=574774 RepID=A0A8E2JSI4_9PEZI|nr:hypothetical protein AOQ84DRAFT_294188 [Glonium stellatum]
MADSYNEALSNIRKYATESQEAQGSQMDVDVDVSSIETRLDSTLKELQDRVKQQQTALDKLRAASPGGVPTAPSADPRERLRQLLILKDAYKRLIPSGPLLPSRGSVLPAILATRTVQQTISGTREAIASTQEQLEEKEALLRQEEANSHDASLITASIESRIERLRAQKLAKSQQTTSQAATDMIRAKQKKKQDYDSAMKGLGQAFEAFVDENLAGMLAAEELGGPVVGDMTGIDDGILAAGFSQKGRPKSVKKMVPDSKRQRRIDEIWGDKAADDNGEPLSEMDAAGRELRELIEELFNALVAPGDSGVYVNLERDSAASRFLVRAKVAQFHPKDARKLRLIDFGRELDG